MVVFRGMGKLVNTVVGGAAKGGVKVISKAVSTKNEHVGKYIGEVGNVVIDASKGAVDTVTQFADGTIRGGYGVLRKNEVHKQKGWADMKDSTGRTVRGIGSSVTYTVKSAKITLIGLKNKDKVQILEGVSNLGKVAAVTTFAIGFIDIVDGAETVFAEEIATRNDHLNGLSHSETSVPFAEKYVELSNGDQIKATFPVFESKFNVALVEEMYLESDNVHFAIANETLSQAIEENPSLSKEIGITSYDVQALKEGTTPEGYTWHHHEDSGVLQLIDQDTHQNTGHTGGREIWGGGSVHR